MGERVGALNDAERLHPPRPERVGRMNSISLQNAACAAAAGDTREGDGSRRKTARLIVGSLCPSGPARVQDRYAAPRSRPPADPRISNEIVFMHPTREPLSCTASAEQCAAHLLDRISL